jgi:hypothetical protein
VAAHKNRTKRGKNPELATKSLVKSPVLNPAVRRALGTSDDCRSHIALMTRTAPFVQTPDGAVIVDRGAVKAYYNETQIAKITAKLLMIEKKTDNLLLKYVHFPFKNEQARHYAAQGFARRLQVIRRCVYNVFRIIPLATIKIPPKDELYDAQINIQAFLANVYGIIDNLAWVWVFERGLSDKIPKRHVGLGKENKQVRESLSAAFQSYLASIDEWFGYLGEFRHALAHRIPVYIPPGMVRQSNVDAYNDLSKQMTDALNRMEGNEYERLSAEQNRLLIFQPVIAHSTIETKAPYVFHPQMIADFLTVEALGEKMLAELSNHRDKIS